VLNPPSAGEIEIMVLYSPVVKGCTAGFFIWVEMGVVLKVDNLAEGIYSNSEQLSY
jgi:hypothetical protein